MPYLSRPAKINVKLLVILLLVTAALGTSLFAARQVRRSILSKMSLTAGQAAFETQDWPAAFKNFQEYLGRNPDDVEILKKYAQARLSIRPLEVGSITGAISAYRRVLQVAPLDPVASDKLVMLYSSIGSLDELAYVARTRLEHDPNDRKASLRLAEALVQLNKIQEAEATLSTLMKELEALPEKHAEYVQACVLMSQIASHDRSPEARTAALAWLNKAADYAPESVDAIAHRAWFYRQAGEIPGLNEQQRLALARRDLEAADALGTDNPRMRLFVGTEWMACGALDRAAAQLQAVDSLPQEKLTEHFFDMDDWTVTRFLFASELAMRRGALTEGASLADSVLTALQERRHRVQVLPSAIRFYVVTDKAPEARHCLDEYVNAQYAGQGQTESKQQLAYLRALVARVEDKPYAVIDALQPLAATDTPRPEVWRLLAEAYSRTDQTRRAIGALMQYLRHNLRDPAMTLQLARQYSKVKDWGKAYKAAELAASLNSTDLTARLLRIEAGIYFAAEQQESVKIAKLRDLATELEQLRQTYPDRVDIRVSQAAIAICLGQSDKAESELKLAIEECGEPLKAEMQMVEHYRRAGRPADALRVCQAACERHPQVAEPWLALSDLHAAHADYDSARRCLKQVMDTIPDKRQNRSASIQLALLELTHGDRATGVRLLHELAARDEQETHVRSLLLGLREIQAEPAVADRLVGELRKAEGESGLLWRLHQAALWLASEQWRSRQQDVTDMLRYCVDADPEWSAPPLLLVSMYEKLQDFRRVEDTCRQALARNPSATDVADKLVTLLERQNRFSDTEKVLQQVDADPQIASAWQVRMSLRAGDFSRAIDELQLRIADNDEDASSRILLARLVYWHTRDAGRALKYLDQAEAIAPDSMAMIGARVSILKADGDTARAQQILDNRVAGRGDFGAYMMRAAYFAGTGDVERAEQDYRKLTTFAGKGATGHELLSSFYARTGKLDQAVAVLDEGLNAYPADLGLQRRMMKLLLLRAGGEDRRRALGMLADLEERLPRDPELMKLRGLQLLEERTPASLQAAKQKLENAVQLEPTAVDAYLALIGLAMQEQKYEAARDDAILALGSNPNHPALLLARGRSELALGNTPMAAELAHLALRQDPNSVGTLLTAASILSSLGSVELKREGIKLLEQAVTLSPTLVDARLNLASSLYEVGDADKAEAVYRDALARYPDDTRVLNDLAWILQEHRRRYDDALALANKGLSLAPGNVHLLDTRGTILSNMPDRLAEAKSDFEKIVALSSSDTRRKARTLLQLGRVCVKLNDLPDAKQHLNDALEIDQQANVLTQDERSEITNIVQRGGT